MPILHERVRQEKAREELETHRRYNPTYGVTEWRTIDHQMREAKQQRKDKFAAQRNEKSTRRRRFWGILGITTGLIWLLATNYQLIAPYVDSWLADLQPWYLSTVQPVIDSALLWLNQWWLDFNASLGQSLGPEDPEYVYLFATIIFGLALIPVLIFLLGKLVRRIFP